MVDKLVLLRKHIKKIIFFTFRIFLRCVRYGILFRQSENIQVEGVS